MARVVTGASKIVWPSGAARAAACAATIVPAPGRLSTTTGRLSFVLQLLRQQAREHVGAAAGGKRKKKGHRALRIFVGRRLRARRIDGGEAPSDGETEHESSVHAFV